MVTGESKKIIRFVSGFVIAVAKYVREKVRSAWSFLKQYLQRNPYQIFRGFDIKGLK